MQPAELKKMVLDLQKVKSESQNIEIKTANLGCPTKLYDTLSSFSNQDGGGIIIFGINEKKDFEIQGVYDSQDLQKKVSEQCNQMEPLVRALFTVCEVNGKVVVSAEIPGVDVSLRPVFYKGSGRLKGSYIRIGDFDEHMSEYEIYSYEAFRKRIRDDLRVIENANFSLVNEQRLKDYVESIKAERNNLRNNVTDEQILELMGVLVANKPTISALMTFSLYPQAYFPQLCITAVCLPGLKQGETGDDGERFIDNKRITGAIPDMLEDALDFVKRNSKIRTIINESGERIDKSEYPIIAVREAILNALIHRDYSIYTENTPITIEMFRDRLEITNPGGLYGRMSVNELGKIHPETRNPILTNMLEILHITENRYSGVPTIYRELEKNGLPTPVFISRQGEFKIIIKNSLYKENMSLEDKILNYCTIPRSREELVNFVGKTRNYVMSKIIIPLIENKKLRMTIPDKPKSYNQKYIKNN